MSTIPRLILTAAACVMLAEAAFAEEGRRSFLRALQSSSCDLYCNNPRSNFCKPSQLADLSITYPKPSTFAGSATTYAKCYVPWIGDGKTQPVLCPPTLIPLNCETCGYSWTNTNAPGLPMEEAPFSSTNDCCRGTVDSDGFRYNYDYKWNIAKAKRSAYSSSQGRCWGWWGCATGYSCQGRSWWGRGTCRLSSNSRFYGEGCSNSDQCNTVTGNRVSMVCSRVSKTCILDEEANREHTVSGMSAKECSCSVFDHQSLGSFFTSLLYCQNFKECAGNSCVRTTKDMKFYCDVDGAHNSKCSNCRASDDACSA